MNETNFIELGWFGFFIFLSVVYYCDSKMFMEGYNTFFFSHKTEEEKKLRQKKIEEKKNEN